MGNGPAVQAKINGAIKKEDFLKLEKLCRDCYFRDNFHEYKSSILTAICSDAIDMLEILLPAGNAKKLLPLHLACRMAKLESVELLLSAGFSCFMRDELGRTPLHLCSLTLSVESGLCATLLALTGKKATTMLDSDGLAPLHFAAMQNNIQVIKSLLNIGIDMNVISSAGKTAHQIAKEYHNEEATQLFIEYDCNNDTSKNRKGGKKTNKPKKESKADFDRIMAVWERFFENAFKIGGVDLEDSEQDQDSRYYTVINTTSTSTKKSSQPSVSYSKLSEQPYSFSNLRNYEKDQRIIQQRLKQAANKTEESKLCNYETKDEFYTMKSKWGATTELTPTYSTALSPQTVDQKQTMLQYNTSCDIDGVYDWYPPNEYNPSINHSNQDEIPLLSRLLQWFQWTACYDYDSYEADVLTYGEEFSNENVNADAYYYVIHNVTKERRWLSEHIKTFFLLFSSQHLPQEQQNLWYDYDSSRRTISNPLLHLLIEDYLDWIRNDDGIVGNTTSSSNYELHMNSSLPTTLIEAVSKGWMTYYDADNNNCKWLNIPTKSIEAALPLGLGESVVILQQLNLPFVAMTEMSDSNNDNRMMMVDSDHSVWCASNPACSVAWVLVVVVTERNNYNNDNKSYASYSSSSKIDNEAIFYDSSGYNVCNNSSSGSSSSSKEQLEEEKLYRDYCKATGYRHEEDEVTDGNNSKGSYSNNNIRRNRAAAADDCKYTQYDEDRNHASVAMGDKYCCDDNDIDDNDSYSSCCCYYYRNQITNQTTWIAPYGWDELVAFTWNHWTMCCNEGLWDELYWHDFTTGESIWLDENYVTENTS